MALTPEAQATLAAYVAAFYPRRCQYNQLDKELTAYRAAILDYFPADVTQLDVLGFTVCAPWQSRTTLDRQRMLIEVPDLYERFCRETWYRLLVIQPVPALAS